MIRTTVRETMNEAAEVLDTPRRPLTTPQPEESRCCMATQKTIRLAHDDDTPRWHGNPRQYQLEAQARYASHYDKPILPWSWITTACDVPQCLVVTCMSLHAATKIQYPTGICIYCGEPGWTKDHLLPRPITGDTVRQMVAVVPSCGSCNSRIGALGTANVAERRRHAQVRLERKEKHLLLSPHKDDEYLRSVGPALRTVAQHNNVKRERLKARLGWPGWDESFDLRAFQRSGIDDPVAAGLCEVRSLPLRDEYRDVA